MHLTRFVASLRILPVILLSMLMLMVTQPVRAADDAISLGIAQYKDESYEEAAATLQKAYPAHRDSFEVVFYLGMSYMQMLEFDKARRYLQEASRMHPADARLGVYMGEAFFNLHDYPAAEQALQGAINSGIESARAYYFLGLSQYSAGKYRQALDAFRQAVRLDPGMQVKALFLMGMAHRNLGDGKAAGAEFRQVIHLAPGSDEATQAEAMLKQPMPKNYRVSLNLSEQYDSNVVLKPASNVSGVTVTRSRDYVSNVGLSAQVNKRVNNKLGVMANYGFSQSLHRKLTFFDVQTHHVDLTPYLTLGKDQAFMVLNVDGIGVDYRRYMLGFGVMPGYMHDFGDNQRGTFTFAYQRKLFFWADASGSDNRDANNYQVGYSYSWNGPQGGELLRHILPQDGASLNASYALDVEKAGGNNWSYVGNHFTLSGSYPLMEGVRFSAVLDQYRQIYRHINTYYGIRRNDVMTTIAPVLEWQPVSWGTLKASYTFTRALSNISIYDYRRSLGMLSIEGRF